MHQLDAYISLLMAVIEFNLVPPKFNEGCKPIKVAKARNLLVEFQRSKFCQQEYSLPLSSTTIVYGGNGSGKSIYLRTIANIVYLG